MLPGNELVALDRRYNWDFPVPGYQPKNQKIKKVWYIALPLSSAHRGSHSGGGASIPGIGGQEKYSNEGTVYPHASLVEMATYQNIYFPDIDWRYIDMSHESWEKIKREITQDPPDIVAFTVYTATYIWALICAFHLKIANPSCIIVFGNDHASLMRREILSGKYGSRVVDFIGIDNNGPFTMMNLLYHLSGNIEIEKIPSISFVRSGNIIVQSSSTYPLNQRILPNYQLIESYMQDHYDRAFAHWYEQHYSLKRMVTLPIDGGCTWGANPKRRCKHCSIQGLTPKFADTKSVVSSFETLVGHMGSNVYAAGDSTLGFSKNQWRGQHSFLDELATEIAQSSILSGQRFLLAYGLVKEFLNSAAICSSFVRTWNVGIEAFDPKLLKNASKGVNGGLEETIDAFELARKLDYRIYVSGILGLPGTTPALLKREVELWIELAKEYSDIITTISVSLPAVIPGSRMYWECMTNMPGAQAMHSEITPCRQLSRLYVEKTTEVKLEDVEEAVTEVGRGVIGLSKNRDFLVKFGGYLLGGHDDSEMKERLLLDSLLHEYDKVKHIA